MRDLAAAMRRAVDRCAPMIWSVRSQACDRTVVITHAWKKSGLLEKMVVGRRRRRSHDGGSIVEGARGGPPHQKVPWHLANTREAQGLPERARSVDWEGR